MALYTIENKELLLTIDSSGAEIKSLKDKKTNNEYMWQADPKYWGRTAPVLFPVVGNYRDKTSVFEGKSYTLGQHGFARDSEFNLKSSDESSISFVLQDSAKTKEVYPFSFLLQITYTLTGRTVTVGYHIENPDDRTMYFSIGAHPAFNCDIASSKFVFDTTRTLSCGVLNEKGVLTDEKREIELADSCLELSDELFARDALIIEGGQTHKVALAKNDGRKIVELNFDAPLVGLWSPKGKHAPFVCIEPWYGRADRADFNQKLEEREWGNTLPGHESFDKSYDITVY